MPEQLFVFIQFEFPWELGPPDGRYLMRDGPDAEPERVVVLGTLRPDGSASPTTLAGTDRPARRRFGARRTRPASPDPVPVSTMRATVIDPLPLSADGQARAWLAELDREREVAAAAAVLNRVVHSHRIAAADPYVREISPAQALVVRAGWGEGEQVADGSWLHARELPVASPGGVRRRGGRRDRSAALRPQERLAALLGGRATMLLCEELTLRARLDLDEGRPAHAALQLDAAYAAALRELRRERRPELALRLAELEKLRPQVEANARAALPEPGDPEDAQPIAGPDTEILEHALVRLESALRARTAVGFNLT